MVRVLCLSVALAAFALAAEAVAKPAERPGDLEQQVGRFELNRIEGLAVGADGRIVVAGRGEGYPNFHPWVRAYLPDGSPDPGFGGDGTVELPGDHRAIGGALVQPDGRIVVAHAAGGQYEAGPHLIRRLNADGTPDAGFGSGGTISPEVGLWLTDIALQPDGGLIVVGARTDGGSFSNVRIVVARFLPNGSPDTGFGSNGMTELLAGENGLLAEVAVQPGGGLVLTLPKGGSGLKITRLSADGRLDGSFGRGGLAPVELGRPAWRRYLVGTVIIGPRAVILDDGRIRIPVSVGRPHRRGYGMAVIGLTRNGHPDRRFGSLGLARGPLPGPRGGESVKTAVADATGGIVVGGGLWSGGEFSADEHTVLSRFRADGSFDRSFGDGGRVHFQPPFMSYPVLDLKLAFADADTLVAAEHSFDGKYQFWGPATLRTLHAGYDEDPPEIAIVVRDCRSIRVQITDLSALDAVVVGVNGRVVRRTTRKRFRVRTRRGGARVSVRATDLAGNVSTERVRLPRC